MANIGDYERTYVDFDWETPERFNFGRDVVDRWAAQDRAAMIWLGTSGEERRLEFAQFSVLSNKFANAARALGIGRGDRVMVLLGKVPEWHAILTGLLKLGAIAIPCVPQLRSGDLKFRAEHSGSVAMISGPEGIGQVEKMRRDSPGLKHFVCVGEENEGWGSFEDLVDGASEDSAAEDTASDDGAFRDGGCLPGRLLPHRGSGVQGRGRVPVVRGPLRRRDPLSRLPHRPLRSRERPHRAPGRRRERGGAIIGRGPRERGQGLRRPGADYELSDGLAREIQDFCRAQTAPYKDPRRIEFLPELPKTTSGKIRRVELKQRETV